MGAAGRDFHNFNVFFRGNPGYKVVAFTATQIPNIQDRMYPERLAGNGYPGGIPIRPEEELPDLIRKLEVRQVVFAYSDVPHEHVMHRGSLVLSCGADFVLMGPESTMLQAQVPVVAVTAVRTGAGKSQTTRRVGEILSRWGRRVVVVRHPMPYGRLDRQVVQRFASHEDLDSHYCTIEEREEYEPHIDRGNVVYAGVDYGEILKEAQKEADIILWDGGNNDLPFYRPDTHITVVDPHRPGHELSYHPGETNLRMASIVIVNKVDTAGPEGVRQVLENVRQVNPEAVVLEASSPVTIDDPKAVRGKRVLVLEDGPTLTHGGMPYGAGVIAARKYGAQSLVDPRPFARGSIRDTFLRYPHLRELVPAMGYGPEQIAELEQTVNAADADLVVVGTPIDVRKLMKLNKPSVRVRYELEEKEPGLEVLLSRYREPVLAGKKT
ncbi:MAG: GTPase [Firmicutes bacterium]|nr:GTPase [Bacillota bacterium]